MKFIELNKNLKERVENLYNIEGNDFFLIKQALINLKSVIVKDMEEFNYLKVDAFQMKKEQVEEQLLMFPMMNDYRLLVLANPSQDIVKFLNKYDFSESSTIVVCINASNLNVGEKIDCSMLDRADITKYILNYIAKAKLSIQEQAIDYLIDATNGDMSKIVNELNKIVSYCAYEDVVTIDIVTNLVANSSEYAIFMLTNAIDNKDYANFQKILNQLEKTSSQGEIFSYLGKYFKRMQYIALSKQDDELTKILNIKPYAIKMARQYITKNGIKFYINLYDKYIELDYEIKSGKITPNNALYKLIF